MRKSGLIIIACSIFLLLSAVHVSLAKQEFYGIVQKMPARGFVGTWIISGRTVHVTKDTELDQDDGPLRPGAFVEVEGYWFRGKFIATEIETKKRK